MSATVGNYSNWILNKCDRTVCWEANSTCQIWKSGQDFEVHIYFSFFVFFKVIYTHEVTVNKNSFFFFFLLTCGVLINFTQYPLISFTGKN